MLSLDIEGAEDVVLQTIPWDKVDIETLLIEVRSTEIFFNIVIAAIFIKISEYFKIYLLRYFTCLASLCKWKYKIFYLTLEFKISGIC